MKLAGFLELPISNSERLEIRTAQSAAQGSSIGGLVYELNSVLSQTYHSISSVTLGA